MFRRTMILNGALARALVANVRPGPPLAPAPARRTALPPSRRGGRRRRVHHHEGHGGGALTTTVAFASPRARRRALAGEGRILPGMSTSTPPPPTPSSTPRSQRPSSSLSSSSSSVRFLSSSSSSSSDPGEEPRHDVDELPTSTSTSSSSSSSPLLPESANVVVVGGGIIGTSVAYHLAKRGVEDVLLLEGERLTSGTTWHAAGLMVTFGSMSSTSTEMRKYTKELYSTILPEETSTDTGFLPVGFIELACTPDHLHYYRRVAAFDRLHGIDVHELTPSEVREKFPLCEIGDVLAGFHVPTDGRVNPYDATMALARGARDRGVTIVEGVHVDGVTKTTEDDVMGCVPRVTGVQTSCGRTVEARTAVVNCCGMWARQFARRCGVRTGVPNQAAEHYYLLTEPMDEIDMSWPVIEDPSRCVYIRPEGGGLMLGLFERVGAPWNATVEGVPESGFGPFGEITPDWDRMGPYLEEAMGRVPIVENVGMKSLFCGPESFTPDNNPIVGEAPELRGYYVAAGMNSIGILTGGGVGKLLAEWIDTGLAPADTDVTGINPTRFHRHQSNPSYRAERVVESLGNTYKIHYPDYSPKTCRGIRTSALHDRMKEEGAYFRDVSGWESPAWFAPRGTSPPVVERTESFGRESWFDLWAEEHDACRNGVAIFDMSFMSKFLVQGSDAGSFLNRLSTANVDGESGKITYTQWLNEAGRMEADLTVTKMPDDDDNTFLVVATDTMHNHVLTHMKWRVGNGDEHVCITDVTGAYAQINVQGPKSRQLLQSLTSCDLGNEAFPFRTVEEIDVGHARVWCGRITYVGELGYELFVPVEFAQYVYDVIREGKRRFGDGGETFDVRNAGLRALGSLRMEKGYRDYGHDMDNTDTLLECGLGFTCDFNKPSGFIGMEHVLEQKAKAKAEGGLRKRMVSVLVNDPEPLLHHGEVLWRDGIRVCDVRSASYGHTLGGAVGLAMVEAGEDRPVDKSYLNGGCWEVEIAERRYPCHVSLSAFYDPKNTRIKM